MIRPQAVTEIPLRFYSFHLLFLSRNMRRQGAADPVDAEQRGRALRAYPALRGVVDGCLADRSAARPSR
jgi:hypothetical protein